MKRVLFFSLSIFILFSLTGCTNGSELAKLEENVTLLEETIKLKDNEINDLQYENEILKDKIEELEKEYVIIKPKDNSEISLEHYTLLEKYEVDFDNDNNNETVELYAQVGIYEGEYMWDDGQNWMLLIRDGERSFVLHEGYVQLGVIKVKLYESFNDNNIHLISVLEAGAGYQLKDYVYDSENDIVIEKFIHEEFNLSWIQ